VLALLLDAQNDMRWTTSPRLSLELALVRATMPETDADASALVTRLERLERLANLDPGAVVPTEADVAQARGPSNPADDIEPVPPAEPVEAVEPAASAAGTQPERSAEPDTAAATPEPAPEGVVEVPEAAPDQLPVPHAADAGSVDVALLRRSWKSLLDHLSASREMILAAILESATVGTYDGATLELVFPPSIGKVGPIRVQSKKAELQAALGDMFGIKPEVVCVVREVRDAAGPAAVEIVEDDEVVDEAEALKRVQEMLGAQGAEAERSE
jgi:DNA polymerase III subunit gamma/tau